MALAGFRPLGHTWAQFMMGKLLILNRKRVDKAKLADPSISMKEVAA